MVKVAAVAIMILSSWCSSRVYYEFFPVARMGSVLFIYKFGQCNTARDATAGDALTIATRDGAIMRFDSVAITGCGFHTHTPTLGLIIELGKFLIGSTSNLSLVSTLLNCLSPIPISSLVLVTFDLVTRPGLCVDCYDMKDYVTL